MAYEKQNWVCGDTLTAEKLNHMEDGIEDASQSGGDKLIIRVSNVTTEGEDVKTTFDKTWQEVHDALANGNTAIIINEEDINVAQSFVLATFYSDSTTPPYRVSGTAPITTLMADSTDDYIYSLSPASVDEGGGSNV